MERGTSPGESFVVRLLLIVCNFVFSARRLCMFVVLVSVVVVVFLFMYLCVCCYCC